MFNQETLVGTQLFADLDLHYCYCKEHRRGSSIAALTKKSANRPGLSWLNLQLTYRITRIIYEYLRSKLHKQQMLYMIRQL